MNESWNDVVLMMEKSELVKNEHTLKNEESKLPTIQPQNDNITREMGSTAATLVAEEPEGDDREKDAQRTRRFIYMKQSEAFSAFSSEELLRAVDVLEEQVSAPGEVIATQDDVCDDFYFVDMGMVVLGGGCNEAVPKMLGSGNSFGQLILDERRKSTYEFTVTAGDEGATLFRLCKTRFSKMRMSSTLRNVSAFQGMTTDQLTCAVEDLTEQEYEENEVIFHQGDEGDEFFIISSGNALVFINDEDGNPTVEVNRMTEKQSFGELALRGDGTRSATIKAGKGGAMLLKMTKGCFDSIMDTKTKSGDWTTATSRTNISNSGGNGLVWNSKNKLPPVKLNVGDKVCVKLKKRASTQARDAKLVRSGTITRVVSGGSKATIKFDDGGPEKTNVKREDIFLTLNAGARVAVRYRGGQRWYSSKVLPCSQQGLETYNVEFDDGEVQFAVKREHISPLIEVGLSSSRVASIRRTNTMSVQPLWVPPAKHQRSPEQKRIAEVLDMRKEDAAALEWQPRELSEPGSRRKEGKRRRISVVSNKKADGKNASGKIRKGGRRNSRLPRKGGLVENSSSIQLPSLTESLDTLVEHDDSCDSTTPLARSSAFNTPSLMSARNSFGDFDDPLSFRDDLTDDGSVISSSEGSFTEDCFTGLEVKVQDQSSQDLPREPESVFDFAVLSSAFGLSDAAIVKVQAIQAEMRGKRNGQQSHCDNHNTISVDEYVGGGNTNKGTDYQCLFIWDEHLSLMNRLDVQTCERTEEFLTSESTLTNVYFAQSYRDIVLEAAETLQPPARRVCIEAFASKFQQSGAGKMTQSTTDASEEEVQPATDVSLDINVTFDDALEAVQFVLCRIAPNERSDPIRCFRHCNKAAALCMFVVAPPSARIYTLSLCRSFGQMFAGADFRTCLYALFEEMEVDEMNGLFDFDSDKAHPK